MSPTTINKGAYILVISLKKDAEIRIGALGTIPFKKGTYAYVGSAMNNLKKRIDRHLSSSKEKKTHWHIDYFLNNPYTRITKALEFPSEEKLECEISRKMKEKSDSSIKGFGCSDCGCESHLYFNPGSFQKINKQN